MNRKFYRPLRLERLETRDVPTTLLAAPTSPPATTQPAASAVMDPTMDPVDSTSTSVSVLITAVSEPTDGGYVNVTVTGLTASNLQPGASLQLQVGTIAAIVSSYDVNADGSVTLTVMNAGGLTEALAQATTATVIVGNGGTTTPPPATPTPTYSPIMDPTLDPQG